MPTSAIEDWNNAIARLGAAEQELIHWKLHHAAPPPAELLSKVQSCRDAVAATFEAASVLLAQPGFEPTNL